MKEFGYVSDIEFCGVFTDNLRFPVHESRRLHESGVRAYMDIPLDLVGPPEALKLRAQIHDITSENYRTSCP